MLGRLSNIIKNFTPINASNGYALRGKMIAGIKRLGAEGSPLIQFAPSLIPQRENGSQFFIKVKSFIDDVRDSGVMARNLRYGESNLSYKERLRFLYRPTFAQIVGKTIFGIWDFAIRFEKQEYNLSELNQLNVIFKRNPQIGFQLLDDLYNLDSAL